MCLALPAKVLQIKNNIARVDFGDGTIREVNISLVDARIDEYVIVHAGFAIEVLDAKEAEITLELWRKMLMETKR